MGSSESEEAEGAVVGPDYTFDPEFVERELGEGVSAALFEDILATSPLEVHEVTVFGRTHPTPRRVAWHAEPGCVYRYSGQTHAPTPFTPPLRRLREALHATVGLDFDSVLVNHYRHGLDSMGYHSDDEAVFGAEPTIASVSLGASRRFMFRDRATRTQKVEVALTDGSLLVMRGRCQDDWHHALPKMRRVTSARLNLTFRRYQRDLVPKSWRR